MDALIVDYYNELKPEAFFSCGDRTPGSSSCLQCFKRQYYDGNQISYDCEEKRKIYLLRYFPVHKKENYQGAISIDGDVIDSWMERGCVDILSIGGGPGADICGVLEYLEEEARRRHIEIDVNVVRLDIEQQWDGVFHDIMERFFPTVEYQIVHLDVNEGFDLFHGCLFDLVTASYLTSELSTEECFNLADEIDCVLADQGVLMINDRPEAAVEEDIRSMFERINLGYEEQSLRGWAEYNYRPEISQAVCPKLTMKSRMFIGVKE